MARKFALVLVQVMLAGNQSGLQLICSVFVVGAALWLQTAFSPFTRPLQNRLEMLSLVASAVSLLCGVMLGVERLLYRGVM